MVCENSIPVNLVADSSVLPSHSFRSDYQVTYCVYSTWFSRSFKTYKDAMEFVERLKVKYKRISYISLDTSTVLVENFK